MNTTAAAVVPCPHHVHQIVLTKNVIAKIVQTAYGKMSPYRCRGGATRGLDTLIIQYNKDAISSGKELHCLPCAYCRKPVSEGEMCVSKRRSNTSRSHYHPLCARLIHIIL